MPSIMSRHKLVKALDLDEELDDFDGGVDSDYEEEVGAEDKGIYPSLVFQRYAPGQQSLYRRLTLRF